MGYALSGCDVLTEYWPYGLNRAGGLDRFHTAVAEGYGTVIDLRSNHDEPPVTLPADRVAEQARRAIRRYAIRRNTQLY